MALEEALSTTSWSPSPYGRRTGTSAPPTS